MNTGKTILIALLGGQPQVVTFTLDLLLAQGEEIDEVRVVYLAGSPRAHQAYLTLKGEFPGDCYMGRSLPVRPEPVRMGIRELDSVRKPQELEAARRCFYDLFRNLKAEDSRILLSISGGRRVMAMLAFCLAMLHFTTEDRIWHIHTPDELFETVQNGSTMHVPGESGVHLIEVPVVPWTVYLPGLAPLLENGPGELRAAGWQDDLDRMRCLRAWKLLTPRQTEVLNELAMGRTRAQAAAKLGLRVSTVDSHKTAILNACSEAWLGEELRFDIHFLQEHFRRFLLTRRGL